MKDYTFINMKILLWTLCNEGCTLINMKTLLLSLLSNGLVFKQGSCITTPNSSFQSQMYFLFTIFIPFDVLYYPILLDKENIFQV